MGGRLVYEGRAHLTGDHSLPDQFVELRLVVAEIGLHRCGVAVAGGGADGLVGFLRALGASFVGTGRGGHVCGPELLGDVLAGLVAGIVGDGGRVGPHIGNEADLALVADGEAFVKLLGHCHSLLCSKPELSTGLLLQGAGGEGGRRVALGLLFVDLGNRVGGSFEGGTYSLALILVVYGNLAAFAFLVVEQGSECGLLCGLLLIEVGLDCPVLLRDEGGDLLLPVGDHADGGGLDPARRQTLFEFAPEQRAEPVPDYAVQDSAGLLGVDEVHVDFARVVEGLGNGGLGDFVEYDPANGHAFDV